VTREFDQIPEKLLRDLAEAPLIPEEDINAYMFTRGRKKPTRRELDVLRCFASGMTESKTAEALGIHLRTVQQHSKAARYILGAKTQAHTVAMAMRQGLI
jgi:DNA-binding CsgD family transcriptional regulator